MISKRGLSAALTVLFAGTIAAGIEGCAALPALSAIPSVISLAHDVSTSGQNNADTKDQDAGLAANESSSPPPKLSAENLCQMVAIAWPDLMVAELRKGVAGAPEYRELRLLNSRDAARWTPIVDADTGPDGWRPAVNFLKMDFKPPLADVIPDNGTSYLAYAPAAINSNDPNQAGELEPVSGGATGTFSWGGRVYQYKVARTLPCFSPSS